MQTLGEEIIDKLNNINSYKPSKRDKKDKNN